MDYEDEYAEDRDINNDEFTDRSNYDSGSMTDTEDVDERDKVDMSSARRTVWLVKIPEFLFEKLEMISDESVEIGSVKIFQDGSSKVTVNLYDDGPCGDLPKEYDMRFNKKPLPNQMHMFSETGGAPIIRGMVEEECQLKPVLNDDYQNIMKMRNVDANRPRRTVQVVDAGSEGVQVGLIPHVNETELLLKKKRKFEPDLRKERLPKSEVMDKIFKAYEKFAHWSLKALTVETQQPSIYLRDILTEICVFNKRGPYKNLFELKPEFKKK